MNLVKKDAALAIREVALLCAVVMKVDRIALVAPAAEPTEDMPPMREELDCRAINLRRNTTAARALSWS